MAHLHVKNLSQKKVYQYLQCVVAIYYYYSIFYLITCLNSKFQRRSIHSSNSRLNGINANLTAAAHKQQLRSTTRTFM